MKRSMLLLLPMLVLVGCSQQPVYTEQYYQTHKTALKKELVACQPVFRNYREHPKALQRAMTQYHKTGKYPSRTVENCVRAHRAEEESNSDSMFSGATNSILP
ncbi:hypothetical protein [Candidatus Igneacidithiobacillus taiwanensis]|uniref:hypothetical protein n=1 Tax=Candidatus Igneacidithiobacillus taiwanensis TaxID=1945924 RepID=UPI0028A24177|nr:hypothetical protein [Candidatus Igneacidithiobacillus taiwanensis]